MTVERKEPYLSGTEKAESDDRIPTLSERAILEFADSEEDVFSRSHPHPSIADAPMIGDNAPTTADNSTDRPVKPVISAADIEALSDRVLDRIAPVLREAVAAAIMELFVERFRGKR